MTVSATVDDNRTSDASGLNSAPRRSFGPDLFKVAKYSTGAPGSFPHKPYHFGDPAVRVDLPTGRVYRTARGDEYPSVTSVLGVIYKPELHAWRLAVGDAEADVYSKKGADRGTYFHGLMEDYVFGREIEPLDSKRRYEAFVAGKRALDENLTEVNGVEVKLYSDALRMAGTTDLVGSWQGVPAIIDFKTSSSIKEMAEIEHYFLQATAYSIMVQERTRMVHPRLVIIMANVDDTSPIIHVRDRCQDLIDKLYDTRDLFEAQLGM